jgi:hypothetical protein
MLACLVLCSFQLGNVAMRYQIHLMKTTHRKLHALKLKAATLHIRILDAERSHRDTSALRASLSSLQALIRSLS